MRAMVLRGTDLTVEEVPMPRPGAGQVLAKVRASGICGSDLHYARYAPTLQAASRAVRGVLANAEPGAPLVMGHEFVAEITEVAPDVERWQAGDRVVSMPTLVGTQGAHSIGYSTQFPGAYGEYVLMSAPLLLRVPDALPDAIAALTEPCAVALHGVRESGIKTGQRALVMGAGPIGLLTMLWLKYEGIWAAVSDPAAPRRGLAEKLGADLVIDPAGEDASARLAASGGAPAYVFECVGIEGTLQEAMNLVARRGKVVVVGVCMVEDRIQPLLGINKHLNLQFVLGYTPGEFAEALDGLAGAAIPGSVLVTRSVSLDEMPDAFRALANPDDCKVMLEFPA